MARTQDCAFSLSAVSVHPLGLVDVPEITETKDHIPLAWCMHQEINLLTNFNPLMCLLNQPHWKCSS